MAQKFVVSLIDDLSGEEFTDGETVEFGLDGKAYEIDLGDANAAELRDVLAVYVENGRRVQHPVRMTLKGNRQTWSTTVSASSLHGYNKETKQQIRAWGRENGWEVSARGRLAGPLVEAWERAHQGSAA